MCSCNGGSNTSTCFCFCSTLTAVPVERQKLLCKGKTIKTSADLQTLSSAGALKIMLMGTAEGKVEMNPPPEKTVFVEDLTPAQQAALLKEKQLEPLPNVRQGSLNHRTKCLCHCLGLYLTKY